MKRLLVCGLLCGLSTPAVMAQDNVGVALMAFNNQFQTLLRGAIEEAGEGLALQFEDGQFDTTRQGDQVNNLIASNVAGLIVSPIDAAATGPVTAAATAAGIPLVYVNNKPLEELPDGVAFVGSDETEAGTLLMEEVCRRMGGEGSLLIIMGGLSFEQTRLRTGAADEVLSRPECSGIEVLDRQAGDWSRISGLDLTTNWLTAGLQPKAIIANNDDMALGAVQALTGAGMAVGGEDGVIVGGIDATPDAINAIAAGEMSVTVFQDAVGQGKGAVDAVKAMIAGEPVEKEILIPFQLVTSDNVAEYQD